MPVSVKRLRGKFRLVEPGGAIAKRNGKAIDSGGSLSKAKVVKQAQAINLSKRKR